MIRLGIIGVGNRGEVSILTEQADANVKIIAAADIHYPYLKSYSKLLNRELFLTNDYQELVERTDLDAVMIFSPDYLHQEHAVAALNAGKHVFIEKPMAITVEGCDAIIAAAHKNKKMIYVGHNMRHMFFLKKMRSLILEGMIGEVKAIWVRHFISRGGDCYFKDWHADRSKSNSLLVHKGVHDIDAIHWLGGAYSSQVQGMGSLSLYGDITDRKDVILPGEQDRSMDYWPPKTLKGLNPVIDVEDLSMIQMQLKNGVLASYQQCHYTPDYWRNFTVIGTEGRIENFGTRTEGSSIELFNTKKIYSRKGDVCYTLPAEYLNGDSPDLREMAEFIEFLRGHRPDLNSALSAREAVAAAVAATLSLRNGSRPYSLG